MEEAGSMEHTASIGPAFVVPTEEMLIKERGAA
jgi:hypothetical protein